MNPSLQVYLVFNMHLSHAVIYCYSKPLLL